MRGDVQRLRACGGASRRRSDMFKMKAMDHIVLNVPDIARSLALYTDVLRLEPERLDEFRRGEVRFPSVRISADTVIDLFPMKPGEALGKIGRASCRERGDGSVGA